MHERSQLQSLLSNYLSDDIPLYELRGQFYSDELIATVDTEEALYRAVSMHLAFYTVGDWPESTLKEAIGWHLARRNGEQISPPIPMMDSQWAEIMASGIAPWPVDRKVFTMPILEGE